MRSKPSWTVTDSCGAYVFEEMKHGFKHLQTWAKKRDAQFIADHCRQFGVAATKAKLNAS